MKINLTENEITLIVRAAERSGDMFDSDNVFYGRNNPDKANSYYDLAFKFLKIREFLHSQEDKYEEVRDYGYDYNGMFFFNPEEVEKLFYNYTIYKCYPDGTDTLLESWNQIEDGFYYGIEKDDYIIEV